MKSSKIRSQESFVENLFESYSVSFVIYQYLSIFLSSKSWIESIRAIIQPIRKDIFKRKYLFNGNLNCKNQNKSLSPFLLALKSMLPGGEVNIKIKCSQAVLALSGIVTYNIRKLKKSTHALKHRHHKREHKTPVTMYVGLKYSTVRSKIIIDHLFHLGISLSYDRMLSIIKFLYVQQNIFLPTNLKKGYFVVLVKDNTDKNS